jgi:hypothetical protein
VWSKLCVLILVMLFTCDLLFGLTVRTTVFKFVVSWFHIDSEKKHEVSRTLFIVVITASNIQLPHHHEQSGKSLQKTIYMICKNCQFTENANFATHAYDSILLHMLTVPAA